MMKKAILMMTMSLMATMTMAQTTVKGVLVDESQHEGEPFATVRVFKKGNTDKPVSMFLTDAQGQFQQSVKGTGQHNIVFSSVGKEDLEVPVDLKGSGTLNLDTLFIKENATALKGVEVVAMKPLVKMEVDKMSYNVADDNDSKTSTVLDMLRKVPMVTVDGQDNITVNGSGSFKVYVDGKPNAMFSSNASMIFKNMPAAAVKSIEVVTNPGAKYDAEGTGGVLNIVLNRQAVGAADMNGYNGTLRAQAGTNALGAGAFVNGQQGKLSYNTTLIFSRMSPNTTKVTSEVDQASMKQTGISRTKTRIPVAMGSLSLGYDIDSMSTMSLTAEITSMRMKNTGSTETRLQMQNWTQGTWDFNYGNDLVLKNNQTEFSGSVDYQRFLNRERTSSFSVIYQLSYSPTHNEQRTDFEALAGLPIDLTDRLSDNHEKTTEQTVQTDFTTPLAQGHTLSLGAKLMLRKATSDAGMSYFDNWGNITSEIIQDYEHKNRIGAAYAEYEAKWGNVGAKAGLRYEHTWQDVVYKKGIAADFSTDYGNLVPSASLSYALAPTSNLGLTYNMRISRPGITYLNPYVDRSNPVALTYGNSDLEVEKTHNVALVFNAFSQKIMLNLNLSHNFTDNAIEQYSFDDGQYLNTTYGNIVKRHMTGLSGYVNWLLFKNTRLFVNGGVSYSDLRSDVLDVKNNGWSANFMGGLQQTLPWDLKLGAYLISQSKTYTLQGWSGGMNLLVGNLTKSFFNDKLTLGLQGLTGLNDGGCLKIETYSGGKDFVNHMNIRVPIYSVSFTLSYTFGNTKQQFQQQRQTRVDNNYIEQQSQGEVLQGVGGATGGGVGGM